VRDALHSRRTNFIEDGALLTGRFDYDLGAGGTFSNISTSTGPGTFQYATELLGWH